MSNDPQTETATVPMCGSCVEHETCLAKEQGICRKYHTKVLELYDGSRVSFGCPVNSRASQWFKREECSEPEEIELIAAQLQVRLKDVWKVLFDDRIPRSHAPALFPEFDVSEPLDAVEKQRIRYKVAEWLMENNSFLTVKDSEVLHVYKDGVYEPNGEEIVVEAIRRAMGEQCNSYDRNEVRATIRDKTLADRTIFSHSERKICLANGILDLDILEFKEHSPREHFLEKVPVKYDPEATCPTIEKFHSEIVEASDVQTLYEIIGYCLYPAYPLHKALMLVGDGANGKSTWLNMVKTFLGPKNCSSVSLQGLESSRFATSVLVGKYANIYPDIPDMTLKTTGTFKMLVGADPIGAEFKFGKYFTFENHAKLLFSANKIPETHDDTEAFFRRWMIVVFPNRFTPHSEPKVDPNILDKITTAEELSGLLNKALRALSELLQRHSFTSDKPTSEWREDYIRKSDPVAAFYMDKLEEVNDLKTYVSKAELYRAFVVYCKECKLPAVDNVVFSRKIKSHITIANESTTGEHGGSRQKIWRNLKFKEDSEEKKKIDDFV